MKKITTAAIIALLSTPAYAALHPVTGAVEYEQGVPTVTSDMADSSVRLIPTGKWNGRYAFRVAAANDAVDSVNIGTQSVTMNDQSALSVKEMGGIEKKKAFWQSMAIAALSAGITATAPSNRTSITSRTPYGVYRTVIRQPGNGGSFAAFGALGVAARQIGLRRSLEGLNDEVMQTTTVHQGESYGGLVVAPKLKGAKTVTVRVTVGADTHVFEFQEDGQ